MPCNSDWPTDNSEERYVGEVAEHFVFLAEHTGARVPQYVSDAARLGYGKAKYSDRLTRKLCSLCFNTEETVQSLTDTVKGLKLNIWWLQHKEMDAVRRREEEHEARERKLRESAVRKIKGVLSEEEFDSLGL